MATVVNALSREKHIKCRFVASIPDQESIIMGKMSFDQQKFIKRIAILLLHDVLGDEHVAILLYTDYIHNKYTHHIYYLKS